jgi:hypothetical protein
LQVPSDPPENVTITGPEQRGYRRPWLAQDPVEADRVAVAYEDGNSPSACYLGLSDDGGSTWDNLAVIGQEGRFPFPDGFDRCQRPATAFGPDGVLYYAVSALKPSSTFPPPAVILVLTSTDGGQSFSEPVQVQQDVEGASDLNIAMIVGSGGELQLVWQANTPSPPSIQASTSGDQGRTFSPPVLVSSPPGPHSRPNLAVGPNDGVVHVVYIDGERQQSTGEAPARVVSSSDGGATFAGEPTTALDLRSCSSTDGSCQMDPQGNYTFNPSVSVATGPSPGQVYVAGSGLDADGLFRLSFALSEDEGRTWERTERLGIRPGEGEHHQIVPSMSVAADGRIDIVYYDLEEPSGLENTFLVTSRDGGVTFSDPRKISDVASNTAIRGSNSFRNDAFSSGKMVASINERALIAWTDSRRGSLTTGKRDLFFARAEIGAES